MTELEKVIRDILEELHLSAPGHKYCGTMGQMATRLAKAIEEAGYGHCNTCRLRSPTCDGCIDKLATIADRDKTIEELEKKLKKPRFFKYPEVEES